MRAHTIIGIRPPRPPLHASDEEAGDLFHPAVVLGEPPTLSDAARMQFSEARARIEDATVPDITGKDVTVVTLGTGSAVPSKYRNGSYTHFNLRQHYTDLLCDSFWHAPTCPGCRVYSSRCRRGHMGATLKELWNWRMGCFKGLEGHIYKPHSRGPPHWPCKDLVNQTAGGCPRS
jgi:hypothetical protein